MQDQQAVNRVTREQCSSFFHFTAVLPSTLLPIPTVLPWIWSPLPRFPRGYRGIPAVPITVQTSTVISNNNWTYGFQLFRSTSITCYLLFCYCGRLCCAYRCWVYSRSILATISTVCRRTSGPVSYPSICINFCVTDASTRSTLIKRETWRTFPSKSR